MSRTAEQAECWSFCNGILPEVSRSFALIIPRCPPPLDGAMCVAYLICRVADTIEDEPSLDDDQRDILYDAFLDALDEPSDPTLAVDFRSAWTVLPGDEYGRLIDGFPLVLAAYRSLPAEVQPPVVRCVNEMVDGMRQVRPVEVANGIEFLCRDLDDFEQYCHYVAGTVGVMSTTLFETRLDPTCLGSPDRWREQGRRLGLGLQMTNIIKDCRVDAERGVSYIPSGCVDLSRPAYRLYHIARANLTGRAIGHLDAGLEYVLAIPVDETGIRTFLLGSLLPAIATLETAAPGTQYHPKIDRAKMAEILTFIDARLTDNDALRSWYAEHRRRTRAALARPVGSQTEDAT